MIVLKKILVLFIFLLIVIPISVKGDEFTNYIVRDMDSKRVFFERDSNIRKLPASTTKIMTCILGIENNNLFDVVTVGDEILKMDGSNIYLEKNEKILMQDLLYGMMLRSANDAAMVVGKHTSGDINHFVRLMNEKAKDLGLFNTIFNNPTGLDDYEKNYSTVSDLSLLYSYAYKNKIFRDIVGTKKYKASSSNKSYLFNNRMKLLEMYPKATGGKTGYTKKAGRVLVSSARKGNLNIVIASIGDTYGYDKHIKFYEEIFKNYKNYKLLDKDNFNLKKDKKRLYIKNSFIYPLTLEERNKIDKKIVLNKKENDKNEIGKIYIYLNQELIHEEKIFIKNNRKSLIERLKNVF